VRILLLTQLFQPEPNFLKGLRFANELQRRRHRVQVLTGFPNYPDGRVYPAYARRFWQREILNGVEVLRVRHFMSHDRSGSMRALSYMSFALSAAALGVFGVRRPDVIHVYQGPATLMFTAAVLSAVRGGRIVLDIQDLWPESVVGSGMLLSSRIADLIDRFCSWTYRHATRIVVLSQGFKEQLVERGVPAAKVDVVYNWMDEATAGNDAVDAGPSLDESFKSGAFHIVYAGSLGPLQGLDTVIDAAVELKDILPRARFVLVGDGIAADALRARARELALPNVAFIARQPATVVSRILEQADTLLIHLKDSALSRAAIPQKTQVYLAAGRPIIIGVSGEAGALVERAGAGLRCEAGSPAALARAVVQMAGLDENTREEMGRRGRDFYRQHLSFERGCNDMDRIFHQAARE
jgi:colanic acid biosynthesis glycosyl transferase WcaI